MHIYDQLNIIVIISIINIIIIIIIINALQCNNCIEGLPATYAGSQEKLIGYKTQLHNYKS